MEKLSILLLFLASYIVVSLARNFASVQFDTEERKVHIQHNGVTVLETSTGERDEVDLVFRRASDGQHFIQVLMDGDGNLKDCEITENKKALREFSSQFQELELVLLGRKDNAPYLEAPIKSISANELVNIEDINYKQNGNGWMHISFQNISELPSELSSVVDVQSLLKSCHIFQEENKDTEVGLTEAGMDNNELGLENHHSRSKRGISFPGTLWCGGGTNAQYYEELGEEVHADRCCREHDHCPLYIKRWETKFYVSNRSFYTYCYCKCDKKFRRCLERANTTTSRSVGKTFFNTLEIPCFTMKKKKQCVKRSWWGKCEKYEIKDTAKIRAAKRFKL
ncbi:group 3 secretory phospholipase A2-like [Antedon mediterranea]|uniref:group 3 secretory phospholipase A2-like n=1 Tax=Antedon mediterranea TaxID=105859 RepID=UPI003AF4909C